jgi:predicted 2-oxoglutarate/Fe(II)-dependent dioxygenase YbiX
MNISLLQPFTLFTPEQCQSIIQRAQGLEQHQGRVMGWDPQRESRNNSIYWLDITEEESNQFWELARPWHEEYQLTWFQKPVQISCYQAGEYYDWHRDTYDNEGRKSVRSLTLTCTLQTAPGAVFETEAGEFDLAQGEAVFMPSNQRHRARPPVDGERWSFTVWYMKPNLS